MTSCTRVEQSHAMIQHVIIIQNIQFRVGFILSIVCSMASDKCKMTYIHHYSITQDSFSALNFHVLSIHPSHSWQPLVFFQNVKYLELHSMYAV